MRQTFKLVLLLLIVPGIGYSQNNIGKRLDSLFNALQAGKQAMGSVTVTHNGGVIYSGAIGMYRADGAKATVLTRYRIGSLTKTFTAVMVLQLVQEHRLALKMPISSWFPQLPNAARITVDNLLSHTSGIANYTGQYDYASYAYQSANRAQMLVRIARLKPDFDPNQKTYYSNTNYLLLGYIIEQVTGKSYAANVQQRICNKIGLVHTGYPSADAQTNIAQSFDLKNGYWQPVPDTSPAVSGGAGALQSTPADLVLFIRSLFRLKLLAKPALTGMMPFSGNLGRGLVQIPVADQTGFGHFGIIDGFKNSLIYLPQSDVAIAACFNSSNTNDGAVMEQILNIVLKGLSHTVTLSGAQLSRLAGSYTCNILPIKITIGRAGGHLTMQAANRDKLTLETMSPNAFRFAKGDIKLSFASDVRRFTLMQGGKVYEYWR